MIIFAFPIAFLFLIIPVIWRFVMPSVKGLHGDALRVPFLSDLQKITKESKSGISFSTTASTHMPVKAWALWSIWLLLIIALARPQWVGEPIPQRQESHDILFVTDISTSMLEPDFVLNGRENSRLNVVKKTATDFINNRRDDRIGLILFGTNAYLQAPLTYDHHVVKEILAATDAGMAGRSTAIGDALGLALKTLKDSPHPERKLIILLTDGENNDGRLSLAQAIKLAHDQHVKIYTIGVGSEQIYHASFMGIALGGNTSSLDEESLKEIAQATKGRYFRAKDTASLAEIYKIIDKMEPIKSNKELIQDVVEFYYLPLLMALLIVGLWSVISRRNMR